MKDYNICRTCLSMKASKDISDLETQHIDKTCTEIILFCLSIQVENDSRVSTKLCFKCLRKIMSFYNFKLLALKNDTYLKKLESSSCEMSLDEDLKQEDLSSHEIDVNEISPCSEIKYERDSEVDQSDDELLSEIKNIKYEFIPEANQTKENEIDLKAKKGEKGHTENSKTHVCVECGKSVKNLREHTRRHERRRDAHTRIPCPWCDKTFSSYDARSKHKRLIHMGQKKPCPICNKMVKNLKQHTLNMHNSSKLRYVCATCSKRFSCWSALDTHASVHSKDRPHVCDVCKKTFRLLGQLTTHKRQVHDKIKTRMCQFCSKSFSREHHLERHLRIHTNEKPYQCKECGKAFNTDSTLKNHMFVHSEKKNFICKICDKRFAGPRYLSNHMLTHTREKRWQCRYCDVKFHRSDHRTQHEAAVHKIKKTPDLLK